MLLRRCFGTATLRLVFRLLPIAALAMFAGASGFADVYVDPQGDTFGPSGVDIGAYSAHYDGTNTVFSMSFWGDIAPAHTNGMNSVLGYVEIDLDRNPATGAPSLVAAYSGYPIDLGVERLVDLGSELFHPGKVDFYDVIASTVTSVSITYGPASLSFTLPISGLFTFGAVVGNPVSPSDRIPNSVMPAYSQAATVPESATAFLCGLGFLAFIVVKARPMLDRLRKNSPKLRQTSD